jgi:hypothetical protein
LFTDNKMSVNGNSLLYIWPSKATDYPGIEDKVVVTVTTHSINSSLVRPTEPRHAPPALPARLAASGSQRGRAVARRG